jgi:hypothetical protein
MFLTSSFRKKTNTETFSLVIRLLGVAFLCLYLSPAAHAANCVMEFPVYDPFGTRLTFDVSRVSPQENPKVNLLSVNPHDLTSKGDRVFFNSLGLIGRGLEVVLQGPNGSHVTTRTVVTACRLRRSLFWGVSDTGADVNGITVDGRLSGCQIIGDWWVRAVPEFGGHEGEGDYTVDGYVESDGRFSLVLGPLGVRRLLIVGHAKSPIKVIAVDVTQGKATHLGTIDISGACPSS